MLLCNNADVTTVIYLNIQKTYHYDFTRYH